MDMLCHLSVVMIMFRIASSSSSSVETVPTYEHQLPSGKILTCARCKPGYYLQKHCTETEQTVCRECEKGYFTEYYNYVPQCLVCDFCLPEQNVKHQCSSSQNAVCECKEGTYWNIHYCKKHRHCPNGYGIQEKGTPIKDTVCVQCATGSYAAGNPANKTCVPYTTCKSGQKLLFHGNSNTDNVCFTCDDIKHIGEDGLLRPVLMKILSSHKSRRLVHVLKRLSNSRRSGFSNDLTDLIQMSLKHVPLEQLREVLWSHNLFSLADKVQHKITRVKEEVKLCNNDITGSL